MLTTLTCNILFVIVTGLSLDWGSHPSGVSSLNRTQFCKTVFQTSTRCHLFLVGTWKIKKT